jgi:hypothetical protein
MQLILIFQIPQLKTTHFYHGTRFSTGKFSFDGPTDAMKIVVPKQRKGTGIYYSA